MHTLTNIKFDEPDHSKKETEASETMDYTKKTNAELVSLCKDLGIRGYSGKKKADIIELLHKHTTEQKSVKSVESVENIVPTNNPTRWNMIDLFAGTGAFTHAFQSTGKVQCVFANDMVEWSKTIYDSNFPSHQLTLADLNNIEEETIPSHDILTGGFPCFVAGTKVVTDNGYKNIEDVLLTDKLLTHKGTYQKILNQQKKYGVTTLQQINIMYHPHIIQATEEHPFYVRERIKIWNNECRTYKYSFKEPMWIPANKLHKQHYVGMPVNRNAVIPTFTVIKKVNQNTNKMVEITLDRMDQWFMMGYFLGDGWIEKTKKKNGRLTYGIRFAIADKDRDKIIPILNRILPLTSKGKRSGLSETYGCSNQEWFTILDKFHQYAENKIIPEWIHDGPIDLIESFLEGYSKADGCVCPSSRGIMNHHISFTTVSTNIAFGVQRLYSKLGKMCSVDYTERQKTCVIEGRTVNQKNTYRMRVVLRRLRDPSSFIEGDYTWHKIKSVNTISDMDPQDVYNFEVEHDNSYCVENAIVHNCQPFSIAGKQEGFNDERSNVFWKILRIIDRHQPSCIVLENVKNLVSHDEGKTFTTIKDNLEKHGYHLRYKVLNTSSITTIPQHRERIYIVGLKDKSIYDKFTLDFDEVEKQPVSNMFEEKVNDKYYYTDKSSTWKLVKEHVTKKNTIYQYRRVYVRENKSNECPTLTANMGGGGHNVPIILDHKGIRKLTPRECFNFQGFPTHYNLPAMSDTNLYKLAGNAVSVPVVTLIANRLITLLEKELPKS